MTLSDLPQAPLISLAEEIWLLVCFGYPLGGFGHLGCGRSGQEILLITTRFGVVAGR